MFLSNLRDKNFLLVGAGRVSIFVPIYSSNHRENYKSGLKKMSRTAWKRGVCPQRLSKAYKRIGNHPDLSFRSKRRS